MGRGEQTGDESRAIEALAQSLSLYEMEDPVRIPWAKRTGIVREPLWLRARLQLQARQFADRGIAEGKA